MVWTHTLSHSACSAIVILEIKCLGAHVGTILATCTQRAIVSRLLPHINWPPGCRFTHKRLKPPGHEAGLAVKGSLSLTNAVILAHKNLRRRDMHSAGQTDRTSVLSAVQHIAAAREQ